MILENKTMKILDFNCPEKLHPLKIYTHTVDTNTHTCSYAYKKNQAHSFVRTYMIGYKLVLSTFSE